MFRIRLLGWMACLLAASFWAPLSARSQETAAPAMDRWWNDAWRERYRVTFDDLSEESGGELGLVTFRPQLASLDDPYDIRAILPPAPGQDEAATVPVKVLYWAPHGEMTCLLALEPLRRRQQSTLYLYMDNPAAKPEFSDYPWADPMVLIGSRLRRDYQRHGEWIWRKDDRFGAVHIGSDADSPTTRSTHSITGFPSISCHPHQTRVVQMVWLDPADPPEAFSVDFMSEGQICAACWCTSEPPKNTLASAGALRIGPLPEPGKWARMIVTGEQLKLKKRVRLEGLGFSVYGGTVKWGPTAFGALPAVGQATLRQVLIEETDGVPQVETIALKSVEASLTTSSLRLNIINAPLFAEAGKSLFVTYFVSPWYKYAGDLPDCVLRIRSLNAAGVEIAAREESVVFTGGDNWQRAVEIEPARWAGAESLSAELLCRDRLLTSARLRLLAIPTFKNESIASLKANGRLLQIGPDVVTFVAQPASLWKAAPPRTPLASATTASAAQTSSMLTFTSDIYAAPAPGETLINSDDPRLGVEERVSAYTRRAASEWVVAASGNGRPPFFNNARIIITRDFLDIGLNLNETELFLRGIIQLLQRRPDVQVTMDITALWSGELSKRERALLVKCLEAQSILR